MPFFFFLNKEGFSYWNYFFKTRYYDTCLFGTLWKCISQQPENLSFTLGHTRYFSYSILDEPLVLFCIKFVLGFFYFLGQSFQRNVSNALALVTLRKSRIQGSKQPGLGRNASLRSSPHFVTRLQSVSLAWEHGRVHSFLTFGKGHSYVHILKLFLLHK